jgi:hypothetical protein
VFGNRGVELGFVAEVAAAEQLQLARHHGFQRGETIAANGGEQGGVEQQVGFVIGVEVGPVPGTGQLLVQAAEITQFGLAGAQGGQAAGSPRQPGPDVEQV